MKKKQIPITVINKTGHETKLINITMIVCLMVLQGILLYPLFLNGYSRFIENIEAAHIANAQYLLNHFQEKWNMLWYFGFPVHLTYPPVFPYLIAFISSITSLAITHVYRILTAIFMIITPVSIYWFALYLTGRKTTAFLSSLLYILLPSVAYLFIPQIVMHTPLAGYTPYRLITFAQYGEGPHLGSLFFIPLAALYFIKSFRQPDIKHYILAAIFIALTVLTNLFGGIALLLILGIIILGKMAVYIFSVSYKRILIIGLIAYLLTAFVYDFNFIESILQSGYIHPENAAHWPPFLVIFIAFMFGVFPIALIIRGQLMGIEKNYKWFLVIVWTIVFLTIPAVYYHFGYSLISQPNRYLPELQMGFCMLMAMIITGLWDRYPAQTGKIILAKKTVAIGLTFLVVFLLSYSYISKPYYLINPQSMTNSYEYKIADWLKKNINPSTGERVYLTGTPAFWMTAFAEIPQIRGSADNAQPNPWWADASYQINKGDDIELTKAWLNILNVKYILLNYPESGTHYVDYENYDRFKDYKQIDQFADNGFTMLEVPDGNLTLFSLVNTKDSNYLENIASKKDTAGIKNFAAMLNQTDNSKINYQIISPSEYKVTLNRSFENDVLIFKTNYDKRWVAKDQAGHNLKIESIGPNFIKITPAGLDTTEIHIYTRTIWSEYLGYALTIITVIFCAIILQKRRQQMID